MKHTIIITGLMITAAILSRPVTAADSWQEKMLFNPSPAQLQVEKERQRIMIYEGLTDMQVADAMEQQFGRVEHMMFTGTVITDDRGDAVIDPDSGEPMVENDGCD